MSSRPATRRRAKPRERIPKVGFVSLGCPKALVDSERILTTLRAEGYEVAPTYEQADLVVVNTCAFIDRAKQESIDTILEMAQLKGQEAGRRLPRAVRDRDLVAGVGERAGDGEADAPVASSDENRAAQRITLSIAVCKPLQAGAFAENLSVRPAARTIGHRQWLTGLTVGSLQN